MIRTRLKQELTEAMKAKDQARLSTLRLINAAIKDRDIEARSDEGADGVGEPEIQAILSKMVKQRKDSAKVYEEAGRIELAERELVEIDIIREFLPRQLSEDDVQKAISHAISETGATSIRDMGKIMGVLKSRYAGQMDFGKVGAQVKASLG